jgi:hypothetical protein
VSGSPDELPSGATLPLIQLNRIGGDLEALVWAVGCFWSVRVECVIRRIHPAVNCILLFGGLYFFVGVLVARLGWYGVPPPHFPFPDETMRGFAKLGMFAVCVGLVALVTPGCTRRRLFAAALFPFFGLLSLWVMAMATALAASIGLPDDYLVAEALLRGLVMGLLVASVMSVPATLLYGAAAGPVSALALLPPIAKACWTASQPYTNFDASGGPFLFAWPFLCTIGLLGVFTALSYRWICPGPHVE